MHLDIANAIPNHLGDAIQQIAPVILLRIEKGVLRTLSGGISGGAIGDLWPLVAPLTNTAERSCNRRSSPQWFVVVGECDPGPFRFSGSNAFPHPIPQIRQKPYFRMSRKGHVTGMLSVRFGPPKVHGHRSKPLSQSISYASFVCQKCADLVPLNRGNSLAMSRRLRSTLPERFVGTCRFGYIQLYAVIFRRNSRFCWVILQAGLHPLIDRCLWALFLASSISRRIT